MSKTTPEKLQEYLMMLSNSYAKSIEEGKVPSAESMQALHAVGMDMALSVKRDAKEAELWRKYVKDTEEAMVAFEVKRGVGRDKKGRMN